MEPERALLAKVSYAGTGVESLVGDGIGPEHFREGDASGLWVFLTDHTRKYGQQPSLAAVRSAFPGYDLPIVQDALGFVREKFLDDFDRRQAIRSLEDLADAVNDPSRSDTMGELMLEQARRLSQGMPNTKIARLSDMKSRIAEYDIIAATGSPYGIKMGIPTFDELTFGMQQHEYITVSGWLGTGKSTLAQWIMLNAYKDGHTPMYISLEMEARALLRKWDVMLTNVPYRDLKAGTLSKADRKRWQRVAEDVDSKKAERDLLIIDDVRNFTVDRVYSEMAKHKPGLVTIDYISLMTTARSVGPSTWEKIMFISNSLKQIARSLKIPILAVAQTNRDSVDAGPQLHHVSHSIAINQDSDIVLSLYRSDEMKENNRMEVRMLKNRDGPIKNTDLEWDMSTMRFKEMDRVMPFVRR